MMLKNSKIHSNTEQRHMSQLYQNKQLDLENVGSHRNVVQLK